MPVWLLLYFFPSRGNQAAFSGFFASFPALGGVGEDTTPAISSPARAPWHPGVLNGGLSALAGWTCPQGSGPWCGHSVWPLPGRQASLIPAPLPPPAPAADRALEPRETLPTLSSPCRRLGAQVRPVSRPGARSHLPGFSVGSLNSWPGSALFPSEHRTLPLFLLPQRALIPLHLLLALASG